MKAEVSGGQAHESKYFEVLAEGLDIRGCGSSEEISG